MKHRKNILIHFARYPRGRKLKTRLKSSLSLLLRQKLYEAFLKDILLNAEKLKNVRISVCYTPSTSKKYFSQYGDILTFPQKGRGLGERLHNASIKALSAGFKNVIIRNTDSPTIPVSYISKAFKYLDDNPRQVVIGPNPDGGYYMIGFSVYCPGIFENISWGTDKVLSETLMVLNKKKIPYALLPEWYDVDRPDDLLCLINELRKDSFKKNYKNIFAILSHLTSL